MDVLKEKNLEINPENEKKIREELRKQYGMGAFAKILLSKIEELTKQKPVVLDGLYSWEELKILKEKFQEQLITLAIVVDKEIRYSRLEKREIRPLLNTQAKNRDIAEIENLQKGGPIVFADYYIFNNQGMEQYQNDLKKFTKEVLKEEVL